MVLPASEKVLDYRCQTGSFQHLNVDSSVAEDITIR